MRNHRMSEGVGDFREELAEMLATPVYVIRHRKGATRPLEGPHYPGRLYEVDRVEEIVQVQVPILTPWGHPDPLSEVDWP